MIEPLSSTELVTVLKSRFPELDTMVPQIVKTFDILQSVRKQRPTPTDETESPENKLPVIRSGRFLSTR